VLLPDTYAFQRGETREKIVERMRQAQAKLIDSLWDQRAANLPLKTKEEALILASIVEKETGIAAERKRVASVFINRLRKGMRLQSDPTIIYGIVGGKGKLGRPIRRSEIDAKTAYNTYQIDGLPPTPIANPGRLAIEAVLQPDETEELYFVADGKGGHAFAKTLAEHEANVKLYRKFEREQRELAAKVAEEAARQQASEEKAEQSADSADTSQSDEQAAAAPQEQPATTQEAAQQPESDATQGEVALRSADATDPGAEIAVETTINVPLLRPRPAKIN
jgi:UPF0755 protein